MKNFSIFLALLIPGKQSIIAKVFDVFMEPLVEELLELWTSVAMYDGTKPMALRHLCCMRFSCGQYMTSRDMAQYEDFLTKVMRLVHGVGHS